MKMQSIKIFAVLLVGVLATSSLKAQTENTREPLIKQLKNGTVPGWQFAKNVPAAKPAAGRVTTQAAGKVKSGPLASEQETRKEPVKPVAPLMVIPAQVETKKENPTNKQ